MLLAAAVLGLRPATAATVTWDTSTTTGFQSGNGTWGTDNFWSANGTTLSPWVPGDVATFLGQAAAVTETITIGSNQTIGGLNFGSGTTSGNWTLSGSGTLSVAGNATIAVASGSTAVLSAPLAALSTYVLRKTGAGTLRLNTPTLATPNIRVSAGVLELQKAGTSFSGGSIRVSNGAELAMRSTDTWGAAGTTTAAAITLDGGTLSSNGFFNALNSLTLNGGSINANGGVNASSGSFQLGGTVTVNLDASIVQTGSNANINLASTVINVNAGATLTSNAVLQGTSTLTKGGVGELALTGASTYSGGTTLNAGGLIIGHNGALGTGAVTFSGANGWLSSNGTTARTLANALAFSNDAILGNVTRNGLLTLTGATTIANVRTIAVLSDVVFSGAIGGAGSLQKVGMGNLTLSGTNTLSGYLQVQGGKLTLDYGTNNTPKFAGVLNLQGGIVDLKGGSFAQVATSTSLSGEVTLTRSSGTSTLSLGTITRSPGGLLKLQSSGLATTSTGNTNGLLVGVLLNGALAANDGSGNIIAYTAYTDIARQGGVIANAGANNVRISDAGNTTGTVTVGTGVTTINSLVNTAASASTVTIGTGNTLRLGAAGSVIAGSGLNFTGGTLTAGGVDNTAGELQFVVGSGTSTISSVIANNGTGVVSLTKSGDGTLVLTGTSTNTGATYVQAGTLEVTSRLATSYRIESGATLKIGANYSGDLYSPIITLMGSGVGATSGLQLLSGIQYSINGLTLDNAPTTIRNYGGSTAASLYGFDSYNNMLIVNAAASGSVVDATVNLHMSSYGYVVFVNAGAATGTGDLTVNSMLIGSGGGLGFYKRGAGSLKLTGNSAGLAADELSSRVTIEEGRLILAGGDNRLRAIDFRFANDGKLVLGDATSTSAQTIATLSSSSAASSIVGGNAANSALTFGLEVAGSFAGRLGGDLPNENNLRIVKTGAGVLTLSSAGTFTGGTTLSAGGITLGNALALGTGSITLTGGTLNLGAFAVANSVVLNGGAITGTGSIGGLTASLGRVATKLVGSGNLTKSGSGVLELQGSNGATEAYTGNVTLSAGTIKFTGAGSLGAVTSTVAAYEGTIANSGKLEFAGTASQSLTGSISGTGALILSGAGQLFLSGNNSYSGGTTVSAGTATANAATAFGSGAVTLSGSGVVDLGGQAVSNNLVVNGGTLRGGSVDVAKVTASAGTINAALTGSGSFTKSGAGTLVLGAANTYAGGTTVSAGTLVLNAANALGAGAVTLGGGSLDVKGYTVANNITLTADSGIAAADGTLAGVISGNGLLTKSGSGTLTLGGINTFAGGALVGGGTLQVHGEVLGNLVVSNGAKLAGTGVVHDVTVVAGGTINAGGVASVGTLVADTLSLQGGGKIELNLTNATGGAGNGFDRFILGGQLDLSAASSANRVQLLVSGQPTVFNPAASYSFAFLKYGNLNLGGNTNISDLFTLDVSGLKDQAGGTLDVSKFSLVDDFANQQFVLNYGSPVPEPSTYGLSLGCLGLAIAAVRRRRTRAQA